jgi:hypothetical protein
VFSANGAAFDRLGALLFGHQKTLTRIAGGLTLGRGFLFARALALMPWAARSLKVNYRHTVGLAWGASLGRPVRVGMDTTHLGLGFPLPGWVARVP